jgi:3'-phosphoadenosine 5'-phosphosulfate (PAPS) 3'-phosphatase
VKGEGAMADVDGSKKRLQTSDLTSFDEMTLAFSRNHPSKGITAIISEFRFGNAIQRGSIGLKIGLIAEQQADLYIHLSPRTKLWDTCAPQIILEEAGGKLTDLFGARFRYDIRDLQNDTLPFNDGSLAKYIARAQLQKRRAALQGRRPVSPEQHAEKQGLRLTGTDHPALRPYSALKLFVRTLNSSSASGFGVIADTPS